MFLVHLEKKIKKINVIIYNNSLCSESKIEKFYVFSNFGYCKFQFLNIARQQRLAFGIQKSEKEWTAPCRASAGVCDRLVDSNKKYLEILDTV